MSVFADEWRACLREQYKHVTRVNDTITKESLTKVMYQVGFTDDELAHLRIEATMRVEDTPDDFVPDMTILENQTEATPEPQPVQNSPQEFQPHPLECQCPACIEISLTPHDEEGQPIEVDEEDPNAPKQMTMF